MIVKVKAELILNIPNPKTKDSVGRLMIMAEQNINTRCQYFLMPETRTRVGTRVHIKERKRIR